MVKTVRKMKNGKAAAEDGIKIEFIKGLPSCWANELYKILNGFWLNGILGKGWEKAGMVPIFKGGDENDTGKYRGVSLLDTGYKILAGILDERIREWMEKKNLYKESQAGFRKHSGRQEIIFLY